MSNRLYQLIKWSIFIVPFSGFIKIRSADVWYAQYLGLICVFLLGITMLIYELNKALAVFSVLMIFSTMVVSGQYPRSLLCLIQFFLSLLAIYGVSKFHVEQRRSCIKFLVILLFIQGFIVLLQYFNLDPIFDLKSDHSRDDTVGISASHNQLGLFMAMMAPVGAIFNVAVIPVILFGLVCSKTTIAYLGATFAAGGYMLMKATRVNRLILIVILAVGIFAWSRFDWPSSGAFAERYQIAKDSIDSTLAGQAVMIETQNDGISKMRVVTTNPLLGFGLGNFTRMSPFMQGVYFNPGVYHRYEHAHNDLVELLFELGITGLLAMVAVLVSLVFAYCRARKTDILNFCFWGMVSMVICSLAIYTVQTALSGMVLIFMLGMFFGELREQRTV